MAKSARPRVFVTREIPTAGLDRIREILGRPKNEKPYLLIPVGYPAQGCAVPDIVKKPLADVMLLR